MVRIPQLETVVTGKAEKSEQREVACQNGRSSDPPTLATESRLTCKTFKDKGLRRCRYRRDRWHGLCIYLGRADNFGVLSCALARANSARGT